MSSQKFFQAWFGNGLLRHYFDEQKGEPPQKHDLAGLHSADKPVVLHGHFNRLRKFGVEDYYPEAGQFITILRDPFELTLSHYFYIRKVGSTWKDKTRIPSEHMENFMLNAKPNMLNHFPRQVTANNYKDIIEEFFIEIGITEHLCDSMKWIARKLDMRFDERLLGHFNATERDQNVPLHIRDLFVEKNQLEFDVYHYALEKFIQQGAPPDDSAGLPDESIIHPGRRGQPRDTREEEKSRPPVF